MNPSLEPTSAGGPPKSHTVLHHVKPETPEVASSARMCSSCEAHVRLPTIRVTYLLISREAWRTAKLATHVRHWLHSGFHLLLGRSASHCSSSHSKRSTVLTKIRFPASAAAAKMSGTGFSALAGCRQFFAIPWTLLRGRIERRTEGAESTYVLCFVIHFPQTRLYAISRTRSIMRRDCQPPKQ